MRKRFTADLDMSDRDMRAFLEIVAQHAISFTMHDLTMHDVSERAPAAVNGNGPAPHAFARRNAPKHVRQPNGHKKPVVFPRDMIVRITNKPENDLTPMQRDMLGKLRELYADTPFRKGAGTMAMREHYGSGSSPSMSALCRHGHIAAA